MSRVEAYICDYAHHLKEESGVVGVSFQEDLFDKLASFPTIPNPAKSFAHYCTDCYREKVLLPAGQLVDRKKDEKVYELKIKELAYSLRSQTVKNYNDKIRAKSFHSGRKKS